MRPVQIGNINTTPGIDPDTNAATQTELVLYPTQRLVELDQTSEAKNKREDADRSNNMILFARSTKNLDGDAIKVFFNSDEGQLLLARICDGFDWHISGG